MKCNVGKTDKIVRFIIGIAVIGAGFWFKSWWGLIGLVPLLTALSGWCPAYTPMNVSSCKEKKD